MRIFMTDVKQISNQGEIIRFDSHYLPDCRSEYFEPEYWQQQNAVIGSALGRGTTHFIKAGMHELVLRHYCRGGLMSIVLSDQYLYLGISSTRAYQEFKLLKRINELGLPAPTPVAYRIIKKGMYYQADLITLKIANANDVHHILQTRSLTQQEWEKIGETIALFHQQQIFHHDLNIHNIMLDNQSKAWLIDFDKCAVKGGNTWKQKNLDRLLRSLNKEKVKFANYHFQASDWQMLLDGYSKI